MATNRWRLEPEYIMSQINSLLDWEKTPAQVRAEDWIVKPEAYVAPTGWAVPEWLGSAAAYYHPNTNAFTPSETYRLRSEWYYNQWDTALWDAYKALWTWSDAYSNTANRMNDFFNVYADDVAKREMALAWIKSDLANKLYNDMAETRTYVMDTFWPNWTLTNEINKYYDDLGNYLATDAGRQAATIAAQWMHSWASLWAIRAQQNEAYNQSFARYVQAKEQEINAKQTIASNLINYMSTLRQEYWDTTNTYIISQYQRANDLLNAISQSIAQSNLELNNARLSNSLKWSSSSGVWLNIDSNLYQETLAKIQSDDALSAYYDMLPSDLRQKLVLSVAQDIVNNAISPQDSSNELTNWWEVVSPLSNWGY